MRAMGTNKQSKGSDLRDKSIEDLQRYVEELGEELFNLRFQRTTGALTNNASKSALVASLILILLSSSTTP